MKTPREQLEELVPAMKAFADECDAKDGGASAEDREKLNKMGSDVTELIDTVKTAAKANGTLDVATAFLGELAGDGAKANKNEELHESGIIDPKGMTFGEAFIKSPAYMEWLGHATSTDGRLKSTRIGDMDHVEVKSFLDRIAGTKTVVTGASSTSGGAFVQNDRYGPVTDLIGQRRLTVRDLCTNVTTASDTFEFVRVTGKTNNAAAVVEASTAADSTVYGTPEADNVQGYKPESAMTFEVASTPVETIAHIMPITRRAAADAPQVRQLVDAFLLYGLKEEEEDQILNGNGTSPNLRGILQTSGISTVGSAGTDIDAIVDAIRTIRADNREPTGMVVHPNDWFSTGFLLAKDSAGNYLIANPGQPVDQLRALWGLSAVVTPAMTENTALVADFTQCVVADREQSALYVTDSHKDWFQRNLLAILAEERLAFAVLDPDAVCTVTAI